jgi:hypothetical protein
MTMELVFVFYCSNSNQHFCFVIENQKTFPTTPYLRGDKSSGEYLESITEHPLQTYSFLLFTCTIDLSRPVECPQLLVASLTQRDPFSLDVSIFSSDTNEHALSVLQTDCASSFDEYSSWHVISRHMLPALRAIHR